MTTFSELNKPYVAFAKYFISEKHKAVKSCRHLSQECIGVGIWRCFCLTLCFHTVIQSHCFRVCLSVHVLFGNPNIISSFRIGVLPFHSTKRCSISQTAFSFMPYKLQNITIHFAHHVLFSSSLQRRMHAWHMLCSNTCTYVIMYNAHTKGE